jgi:hypothetical protein
MSIFASYFWLWSIVGLLGIIMLWTLGALMNVTGFVSPFKRVSQWVDSSPTFVKAGLLAMLLGFVLYPSLIHRIWAGAKAEETRSTFAALPAFDGGRSAAPVEEMSGLFDPTSANGTYIIGWYGTHRDFGEVRAFYESALAQRGWVRADDSDDRATSARQEGATRLRFRDHRDAARSHYSLVLTRVAPTSAEAPSQLAGQPTLYALRLGVVDPRATTQVAWFIDCLVRRAPTFPSCEASGWNPLEDAIGVTSAAAAR